MSEDLRYAITMALIDKAKIEGLINECGRCDHWMKTSDCPREHSNMTGYSKGPSSSDHACDKFKKKHAVVIEVEDE